MTSFASHYRAEQLMSNDDSPHVQFLSSALQKVTGTHLNELQLWQLKQVLCILPTRSGLGELDAALVGYEELSPFRRALQEIAGQGAYGGLFDLSENAANIVSQASTHVLLKGSQ